MIFTSNVDAVNKDLLNSVAKMKKAVEKVGKMALFRMGLEMKNTAINLAPFKGGTLRRSITMIPNSFTTINNRVIVGTPLIYGAQRDFGGTISAKNSQYLTIPIGGTRGSIKNYQGFFIKTKAGKLLFVQNVGKGKIKPLFVLKRSVYQKGKPYLTRAYEIITLGRGNAILKEEFSKIGFEVK